MNESKKYLKQKCQKTVTRISDIEQNTATANFALRNNVRQILPFVSRRYVQLFVLLTAYILSNIFRTLPAMLAPGISYEYSLSVQSVGYFLTAFNFAFGAMQLFVGVAVDRFGPMRTVAALSTFACVGSVLSCFAPSFAILLVGQALIGVGCSGVFLGCLVFISRHFDAKSFATLSGIVLGLGGIGMLLSATPLAVLVDAWSWRGAFVVISIATVLVTTTCFLFPEQREATNFQSETFFYSFRLLGSLFRRRGTHGILLMGSVGYAAMITVRGFWIVPLLSERQGLSLVQSGNVVLLLSFGMTLSPLVFGWIDPGGRLRRLLIVASALVMSSAIWWLGLTSSYSLLPALTAVLLIGAVSGFTILQYADVRSSFEPEVIGRALSLLNMSVFLGAAIVQVVAGLVSEKAASVGANSVQYVFCSLSLIVIVGCISFLLMPAPRLLLKKEKALPS